MTCSAGSHKQCEREDQREQDLRQEKWRVKDVYREERQDQRAHYADAPAEHAPAYVVRHDARGRPCECAEDCRRQCVRSEEEVEDAQYRGPAGWIASGRCVVERLGVAVALRDRASGMQVVRYIVDARRYGVIDRSGLIDRPVNALDVRAENPNHARNRREEED